MGEVRLSVTVTGIQMATPLILASGCCGYGIEMERLEGWRWDCIGAVVLKGVTLRPRSGNPPHRVAETPAGMLNSIGLQNIGVDALVEKLNGELRRMPVPLIANVNGETEEEFAQICERLKGAPKISGVELNISCPNIERGGIEFGMEPETAAAVVRSVRRVWDKPLWVKLSPEPHPIADIAEACVEAGADALCLCNTFPALALDTRFLPPRSKLGVRFGGLSGPAIKPIVVRKVFLVYGHLKSKGKLVPLIGVGGIWSGGDVLEYLSVGAKAVQIGTVLFSDPLAPIRIVTEMKTALQRFADETGDERWLDVKSFVGIAH